MRACCWALKLPMRGKAAWRTHVCRGRREGVSRRMQSVRDRGSDGDKDTACRACKETPPWPSGGVRRLVHGVGLQQVG